MGLFQFKIHIACRSWTQYTQGYIFGCIGYSQILLQAYFKQTVSLQQLWALVVAIGRLQL